MDFREKGTRMFSMLYRKFPFNWYRSLLQYKDSFNVPT